MKDDNKTKEQLIEELKQLRQGIIELKESETKRKCAEEALRESDEKYRLLAESLPDLVYEFDPEGKFIYVNEAVTHLFGYSKDEFLSDIRVHDTIVEEDKVQSGKAIHDILKGKTTVEERTLIRKDGSTFIGEIHSAPIYKGKDIVGVRGVLRDITERKKLEEALQESEKRFRDLANLLPEAVYEIDLDGKFTFANQRALQVSGYSRVDLEKGLNALEMFIPEDRGRVKKNIARILAGADLGFMEYTAQRKDGSTFPVMIHSIPIVHESNVVGLRGIIINISGLKETERKIRTLSSAIEQSIDGIAIGDLELKLLYVNRAFARMHGYTPEEMIGMKVVDLHNEEQMGEYKRSLNQIKTKGSWRGEIGHIREDGTPFPTYMSTTLLEDDNGKHTGILVVTKDITERKQTEGKLLTYQEQLRSLASELSLSGERERRRIATELHDSIGHTLALCKIKLGALRESLSSTGHAGHLYEIYELIEQAIQSARSLTFELSPPVLHELGLKAAVEWLAEQIQEKHGILTHVDDDRQPKLIDEDVQILLFQATRELLVNVIKHARARNARVSICRNCDDMRLSIEDDGVGFDASEIVSSTNSTGGLGFFNIRERLSHIQGHLDIQSEPGHGTRVTIVLPLKPRNETTNRKLI